MMRNSPIYRNTLTRHARGATWMVADDFEPACRGDGAIEETVDRLACKRAAFGPTFAREPV